MLRCIRFGEVLLDETFRTFLICNQCQTEFVEVPEFRLHLASSACGQRLFKDDVIGLKFGAAQVTRASSDKTYLLYNPADVQLATSEPVISTTSVGDNSDDAYLDLMKIEAELLDPRWYTDIASAHSDVGSPQQGLALSQPNNSNKVMEYKDLVEAVGPYVQFKENVSKEKGTSNAIKRLPNKVNNPAAGVKKTVLPSKNERLPTQNSTRILNSTTKRKLNFPAKQVQFSDDVNVKYAVNDKFLPKGTSNKRSPVQNCEDLDKTALATSIFSDGTVVKRRKTITIPMDQVNIHPDLHEQFGRRSSDVPKSTQIKPAVACTPISTTAGAAITKGIVAPPKSKEIAAGVVKSNSVAGAKGVCTTSRPKLSIQPQTQTQSVVINPVAAHKQLNGIKQRPSNPNLLVKNPATYSKINANITRRAPTLSNSSDRTTNETTTSKQVASASIKSAQRVATSTVAVTKTPAPIAPVITTTPPALAPLSSQSCNKSGNHTTAIIQTIGATTKLSAIAHQQTSDILNKLQTLGLQVKRTQPSGALADNVINTAQQNKTLELLQKLQSKGMKVKILNGKQTTFAAGAATTLTNDSINLLMEKRNK